MRNCILLKKLPLLVPLVFLAIQECHCLKELIDFTCPETPGQPMPAFPKTFSADIRINFQEQFMTYDVKQFRDEVGQREAIEIWSPKRHVKYIRHDQTLALIKYEEKSGPTCTVKTSSTMKLEEADAGPKNLLYDIPQFSGGNGILYPSTNGVENGIFFIKWERCFTDPAKNISLAFTEVTWAHPRASEKEQKFVAFFEVQAGSDVAKGSYSNFDTNMPDDVQLSPPENVYCKGYRSDQKPPAMPDYFSYDAELIVYESVEGISPMVSRRKVYYDFPSQIVRTDFYDPLAENQGAFSRIVAKGSSIIHDYNSSIQYNIDPASGKCNTESFKITVDVSEVKETKDSAMLTGMQYFSLNAPDISYNGQFMTRGYLADVYTALVPHLDGSKGKSLYTWYFSAVRTQVVENDKVERNVLLRMVIRPENAVGYQGRVDINFYNFQKEEPKTLVYDISSCYNASYSKTYVLTFPANKDLRGLEKYLKLSIHLALIDVTGLRKQRIFVSEVNFNKLYMFAEFRLLDSPSVLNSELKEKDISLSEAVSRIKNSILEGKFKLSVSTNNGVVLLQPEPNGFNEFAGDRRVESASTYKEGSVIALTIGMLFLGFVLGGVTLNLVISRKYGVSLFQKSNPGNRFDNPLNESGL